MHIAIIIERFDPDAGGNERSAAQMAEQLVARGHAVTILTGSARPGFAIDGVTINAMASRKSSSALRLWRFARWAQRQLAQGDCDVSLSVTMAVPADVLQPRGGTVRETLVRNIAMRRPGAAQLAKRLGIALDPKQRLLLALERRTLADPRVKTVIALSRYVIDQLGVHYGFPEDRVELIPNASVMPAVDAQQMERWRDALRGSWSIEDDATAFLFAATNPRLKGFATLMHATAALRKRGLPVVLLLAGEFGFGHQQWIAELGLRDAVRIIGPTRSMPQLYAAADVTVLPSYYDPSSKVVIESLMMGRPAISTAFNGASDFIVPDDDTARGRVIPDPGDADALAGAMADLCDPAERGKCAAAIGDGLAAELSMARHVDRLEAVLAAAAG